MGQSGIEWEKGMNGNNPPRPTSRQIFLCHILYILCYMIPRKIHQIWIGDNPIADIWKTECDIIRDAHPDFEYNFWTNDTISSLIDEMPPKAKEKYEIYVSAKVWAFASDILRMQILYKHGGVYMDTDFILCKGGSLNVLPFDEKDLMLLNMRTHPERFRAQNCFIAASQGNVFMHRLLNRIGNIEYTLASLDGDPCEKYNTQYITTEYLLHKFPGYKRKLPRHELTHRPARGLNLNKLFEPNDMRIPRIYFQMGKDSTIAMHRNVVSHRFTAEVFNKKNP